MQVRQPASLAQAVAYARLQEEKLLDSRRQQTPRSLATIPSLRAAIGTSQYAISGLNFGGDDVSRLQRGHISYESLSLSVCVCHLAV